MKFGCCHCGSDKGFSQHGEATVDASRDSRSVEWRDGRPFVRWGMVETDWMAHDDLDVEYVACRSCGEEASSAEALIVPLCPNCDKPGPHPENLADCCSRRCMLQVQYAETLAHA